MRCLALAQAWRTLGGEAVFLFSRPDPVLRAVLAGRGVAGVALAGPDAGRQDIEETLALACRTAASWIVLDGYRFGADWTARLAASAAARVLVVDDLAREPAYRADLLLNHNPWAEASLYAGRIAPGAVLAGPEYTLLRPEFLAQRRQGQAVAASASRLLVTFGATGGSGLVEKTLKALESPALGGLETRLVAGHLRRDGLALDVAGLKRRLGLRVLEHVDDMAEVMAWADLALASAGSTAWELMLLGVPSLLTVIADNQLGVAQYAASVGAARNLGRQEVLDAPRLAAALTALAGDAQARQAMRLAGQGRLDGQGALRTARRMLAIAA
jgi:UDP-2,4-diacetamido-2,4,6-trideoxy-beta-L-altropyranose hydrolase